MHGRALKSTRYCYIASESFAEFPDRHSTAIPSAGGYDKLSRVKFVLLSRQKGLLFVLQESPVSVVESVPNHQVQ